MGILRNIVEAMREADREREDMDDDRTTDRYLRSLRRQSRVQDEELEKEYLKKKIKEFEQRRANLLSRATQLRSDIVRERIGEKKSILQQKQFMIPKKRPKNSMMSRGFI